MKKKLTAAIGMMVIISVVFGLTLIANPTGKSELVRIPPGAVIPPPEDEFTSGVGSFCEIFNDENSIVYRAVLDSGMGIAVYMNPTECVLHPYPFQITDVHLYLYEQLKVTYLWPVDIQVNIREVSGGNKCNGPGSILCSKNYSIPSDSAFPRLPRMMNLGFSSPCCVTSPFFLEVKYLSQRDTFTLADLVMDDTVATGPDTCINWFLNLSGYHKWADYWGIDPLPGDAIIRTTGYYCSPECESLWYWKPDTTHAPNGMPDFDQSQFDPSDSAYLDGPAAVANCLWWFGAVPQGTSPPNLIRLLSTYFHTNPDSGTRVDSMEAGLDRYFRHHGYNLYEHTFVQPYFHEMEDSLKKCQDIILLLGFYQLQDKEWIRTGGHYVTMAGVCSESLKVAFSDPFRDAAEYGWPGRVRPPDHQPHPGIYIVHNDSSIVCQDIYQSDTLSPTPGNPHWGIPLYYLPDRIYLFEGKNFSAGSRFEQNGEKFLPGSYNPSQTTYTEVEYAVMICPKQPDTCWYWKKDTTHAPSGMPDFDQYQFGADTSAFCGPTAAANCLKWFKAVPTGVKSDSLIKLLSKYCRTNPDSGTYVDSMTSGLNRYFSDYELHYRAATFTKPSFAEMEDSLKKCQDIILLLGFWQQEGSEWYRVGGHFVTMAGVCSTTQWVGLSDPARDAAEAGWPGRVRPSVHPSHSTGDTLHNDPQYVSHDKYWASLQPASPGGIWELPDYPEFQPILPFAGQNFQTGQWQYYASYNPSKPVFTEVEYAVMVCPTGPDTCWYWKSDDSAYAPSGMPDFGQYQFVSDSSGMCGPTAVANCLWWFHAVREDATPPELIRDLSKRFHTHPDSGTYVDSIAKGLNRYFKTYSSSLKCTTFTKPDFYVMEDSLKKSQDIILLIGFWQWKNGQWYRVGGHFITMAGVCSESTLIAFSDPAKDGAEASGAGWVRPPVHPSHTAGDTLHNDPQYVSHDRYSAFLFSPSPGGIWQVVDYPSSGDVSAFEGQNFQPGQWQYFDYYDPVTQVNVEVEYALMVCPGEPYSTVEEEEGAQTPKGFELYQNHPNPFNSETVIKFSLRKPGEVTLAIYNVLGEKVRTLVKGRFNAGLSSVSWDGKNEKGSDLASGIYFYQLRAGEATQTKRLVLLK